MVAGDYARDCGIRGCGMRGLVRRHSVSFAPSGLAALFTSDLGLAPWAAFLRRFAARGASGLLGLGFEEEVLVEACGDGGFRAVNFAKVFAGFVIYYVIVAVLQASHFY